MKTEEENIERMIDRYWKWVDQRGEDECWPMSPGASGKGRPKIYWKRSEKGQSMYKYASHVALYITTGEWPTYVEHLCDYGLCCNPKHLLDSSHKANMKTMMDHKRHPNQAKTHCPKGHEYALYARTGTRGNGAKFRVCKACERERTWAKRGAPSRMGPKRLSSSTELHT